MKGRCLCGSVTITVPENKNVHACHCGTCVRWNGSPLFSLSYQQKLDISGEDFIQCYQSSQWAERAFCKKCGTHLYYHSLGTNNYELSAGLFSAENEFTLEQEIYIDRKPSFYYLGNDVPKLTEKEFLAKLGLQ